MISKVGSRFTVRKAIISGICLLAPLVLFLAIWSPSAEDAFMKDYLKRISRVTGQSYLPFQLNTPYERTNIPPLKDRQYVIASTHMKAITALDLLQCPRLSQKVAYRNSSLGKQMLPSQQLHYEKELLIELEGCIQYLQSSEPDAEILPLLKNIYSNKQQQLPMVKWNAIFGAQVEFINQLHLTQYPLPEKDSGKQGTLNSLNYLRLYMQAPTTETPYTRYDLEQHLQQLNASSYSGQLIHSALQLTHTLNQVANMLEQRVKLSPICPHDKGTPTGERLHNVFQLLYAGKVQPYLAGITQQGVEWQQAVSQLLSELPPPPASTMKSYLGYIASPQDKPGIWMELQQSVLRHVTVWKKIFEDCLIKP